MKPQTLALVFITSLVACGDDPAGVQAGQCDFEGGEGGASSSVAVRALALSPQGDTLWIGTHVGVSRASLSTGGTTAFKAADTGLASDEIASLVALPDGEVWAGHDRATCQGTGQGFCGLSRFDPASESWSQVHGGNSNLIDDRVRALGHAPDGRIWAGTGAGAAFSPDGSDWLAYFDWQDCGNPGSHCEPLFSFTVADITFDAAGATWLAIEQQAIGVTPKPGGVARRSTNAQTDTWDKDQGLPSGRATSVAIAGGVAWASGPYGAVRLDEGSQTWSLQFEEPVNDMAVLGDQIWLATDDGARFLDARGQWVSVSTAQGLPAARVAALAAVGGTICFGTEAGAACYHTERCAWSTP